MSDWTQERIDEVREALNNGNWRGWEIRGVLDELHEALDEIERLRGCAEQSAEQWKDRVDQEHARASHLLTSLNKACEEIEQLREERDTWKQRANSRRCEYLNQIGDELTEAHARIAELEEAE